MESVRGWLVRPRGLIAIAFVAVLFVVGGIAIWWPVAKRVDECGYGASSDATVPGGCGGVAVGNDLGHVLSGLGLLMVIGVTVVLLWRANVRLRPRLRWPFRASVAVLLVGLAGWVAVPAAASAWHSRQDTAHARAWAKHYEPAVRVLAALPTPAGLTPSPSNKTGGAILMTFLWNGEISPHAAALSFKRALADAGAIRPEVRCQRARKFTLCRVDVRVSGIEVEAIVGPQVTKAPTGNTYHGAAVTVDLPMSFPPSGAWLRVPVE